MTWRDPDDFEQTLLADTRERWPGVIPLARCLTLAPRIEPLLLRNARRRYVPGSQAEVESMLWFSPLVAARSTREIVLHLGVAKALALEWMDEGSEDLKNLWQFTRRHTRHWTAEDRLERDLRYYALLDDEDRLKLGLRDILRRIHEEPEADRKIGLSRLAKRSLPVIAHAGQGPEEAGLLAQYAALALGDAGSWTDIGSKPGQPQSLPAWLAAKLPAPVASAELGVEIRHDPERGQVLHLVAADADSERIAFPSPLPARLHVAGEGRSGAWHTVTLDTRIRISPPSPSLRLITLDGRQWDLRTDELPDPGAGEAGAAARQGLPPLLLTYVEADREQALAIARWLEDKGITAEPVEETAGSPGEGAMVGEGRVVRLWTRAARAFWAERPVEQARGPGGGLLLRTEEVELPAAGAGPGQVLSWQDWFRLDDSPAAERLLRGLQRWRDGAQVEPESEPESGTGPGPGEAGEAVYSDEISALLAEIDDPSTERPRRLEIGDRLAALGDPRPGVGVVEIEVPLKVAGETGAEQQRFPAEVQRLLDEIDDPATEPPRRLAIGDELERRADPRHGVGLAENGLPDIDWVEIPGGPFIYQDGETRELPTFWIARYPVTNRQFQAFIDAGGYSTHGMLKQARRALEKPSAREVAWWQDLKQPEPKSPSWPQGNRPRSDVDWYEAVAFPRWLTAQLGLPGGSVRLPTEFEWEKAARGEEGPIYPWGDEYRSGFANINETAIKDGPWYLKQTTAVGMFPQGRSPYAPYGIEDLAGNVWEWCLNKHDKPDAVRVDTSGDSRCLRGGSWLGASDYARADGRSGGHPEFRNDYWGFRVLSSVPIPAR